MRTQCCDAILRSTPGNTGSVQCAPTGYAVSKTAKSSRKNSRTRMESEPGLEVVVNLVVVEILAAGQNPLFCLRQVASPGCSRNRSNTHQCLWTSALRSRASPRPPAPLSLPQRWHQCLRRHWQSARRSGQSCLSIPTVGDAGNPKAHNSELGKNSIPRLG